MVDTRPPKGLLYCIYASEGSVYTGDNHSNICWSFKTCLSNFGGASVLIPGKRAKQLQSSDTFITLPSSMMKNPHRRQFACHRPEVAAIAAASTFCCCSPSLAAICFNPQRRPLPPLRHCAQAGPWHPSHSSSPPIHHHLPSLHL